MSYEIAYQCVSHIGKVRRINQDNFICKNVFMPETQTNIDSPLSGRVSSVKTTMFGVFDGMGGLECGEVASLIAARTASEMNFGNDLFFDLSQYCVRANEKICEYAEENLIYSMGTTAAILAFSKEKIVLCNIGDSKIFRFSNDEFKQLSFDHVAVGVYGRKPPLSQNLGIPSDEMMIEPFFSHGTYHTGDTYLICSDGLTDMVSEKEIEDTIRNNPFDKLSECLLQMSLDKGGKDNITVLLLNVQKKVNKLVQLFPFRR